MYLISGNITSNVTGNLLVITGNGNIGNITSNFRTLLTAHWLPCKIALLWKKVCYKVPLCENLQRQSSNAFIGLSIHTEMVGGGRPLKGKFSC